MTCQEAAEFVSALYDGETIPRTAAEHIGGCPACQGRLKDYLEIGVELRRVASLDLPERVRERAWDKPQRSLKTLWRKGYETMKIPRFTFALMSGGLVVLASSLAVVGVRAHGDGKVVLLHLALADGASVDCALSTEDGKRSQCGAMGKVGGGTVALRIDLLGKQGDRVELGIRSRGGSFAGETNPIASLASQPEKRYWFQPGDTLKVETEGGAELPVTGEWMDHMPAFPGAHQEVDPGPSELRVFSPLLLRGKAVVGDLGTSGAAVDKSGEGVEVYLPGAGRFRISLSPMPNAVASRVQMNRISFESKGTAYEFVTGTPITRASQVWVVHEPEYRPAAKDLGEGYIGSFDVAVK